MAKILNFEELKVWQSAQDLSVDLFVRFEGCKNFSFTDQLFRAALSVSNNIAEGFDRGSDKEFIRFLNISRGSNSEVKSMMYLAKRLNYISQVEADQFLSLSTSINKMLNALIKAIKNTSRQIK
ncbi:MAG: four helix bundle protein [Spirosomaceae bacterium]|nr:four helix bundle protein [Spirosomataceae bacterium]